MDRPKFLEPGVSGSSSLWSNLWSAAKPAWAFNSPGKAETECMLPKATRSRGGRPGKATWISARRETALRNRNGCDKKQPRTTKGRKRQKRIKSDRPWRWSSWTKGKPWRREPVVRCREEKATSSAIAWPQANKGTRGTVEASREDWSWHSARLGSRPASWLLSKWHWPRLYCRRHRPVLCRSQHKSFNLPTLAKQTFWYICSSSLGGQTRRRERRNHVLKLLARAYRHSPMGVPWRSTRRRMAPQQVQWSPTSNSLIAPITKTHFCLVKQSLPWNNLPLN